MNPIEFRDISYILAVNAERSFSRAAEKYFISQPALSKAVRKVEQQLGMLIFDRSSIPLKLTTEGAAIIEYFQRMQATQEELSDYCSAYHRQRKSDLRIGAPSFFCTYMLPPMIADFQAEYPHLNVKLIESNDHDLREFLQAGALDIGLSVEAPQLSELESFVLQYEHIILAVPKTLAINKKIENLALSYEDIRSERFLSAEVSGISMNELRNEPFLFLKRGNDMYQRGHKACQDAGFEPKIVMELDQLMTAYYLAEAGRGIAFIRSTIPCHVGESSNLLFYKVDHPDMHRPIQVFYGKDGQNTRIQEQFIAFMKKSLL